MVGRHGRSFPYGLKGVPRAGKIKPHGIFIPRGGPCENPAGVFPVVFLLTYDRFVIIIRAVFQPIKKDVKRIFPKERGFYLMKTIKSILATLLTLSVLCMLTACGEEEQKPAAAAKPAAAKPAADKASTGTMPTSGTMPAAGK